MSNVLFLLTMFNFATTVLFAVWYFRQRRANMELSERLSESREANRELTKEICRLTRETELLSNPIYQQFAK